MQNAGHNSDSTAVTDREHELAAIIDAYNAVTDQLKVSHERLSAEVCRLREELADTNRQLRRRERLAALGELAAGVAHEIRNPLGGICMFASLLRRDLADQPNSLRLVEKIINGVTRLERIVTDILEFGRPAEPQPESVQLSVVLADVCELAMAKRPGSRTIVEFATQLEGAEITTDTSLLQRALLNLVQNGLEASEARDPANIQVRIYVVAAESDRFGIQIIDRGAGIPADLQDRIFNPFFTTKSTGTGLGLAIVHQAIETLGGAVSAANHPDGSAMFTIELPKVFKPAEMERPVRKTKSVRSPRKANAGVVVPADMQTAANDANSRNTVSAAA
jgi:signal transduction histidine kinase